MADSRLLPCLMTRLASLGMEPAMIRIEVSIATWADSPAAPD